MVSSHPLFGEGMEQWLRRQTGLDILGRESDVDRASQRIANLQPDVILLDISDKAKDSTMALMGFLRDRLGTKVIGVNLQDSSVCIYCADRLAIREVADLLEVMKGAGFATAPSRSEERRWIEK
jgi:DNA-binding NarL/FixJ family response regulator